MRPSSTRSIGISGSRTVLSASSTGAIKAGSSSPPCGRSISSSPPAGAKSNGSRSIYLLRLHCASVTAAQSRLEPVHLLDQLFRKILSSFGARDPCMELREQRARVGDGLVLQHFGHQRCGRRRDRAAAPLKADIGNALAVEG